MSDRIITDEEADALCEFFDATRDACPMALEAPASPIAWMLIAARHAEERRHWRDIARETAHGYDIEFELSQVGPEPDDIEDEDEWV